MRFFPFTQEKLFVQQELPQVTSTSPKQPLGTTPEFYFYSFYPTPEFYFYNFYPSPKSQFLPQSRTATFSITH